MIPIIAIKGASAIEIFTNLCISASVIPTLPTNLAAIATGANANPNIATAKPALAIVLTFIFSIAGRANLIATNATANGIIAAAIITKLNASCGLRPDGINFIANANAII